MTVLTTQEINKQYGATKDEIDKYFKSHPKLQRTKATIRKVKDRIKASKIARSPGKEVSFTQSAAEWQLIYGQAKVGGVITFVSRSGANNQILHMVVTIAGHQINSVDKLYLDDQEVVFGASPDPRWSTGIIREDGSVAPAAHKVFMSVSNGAVGQSANADLVGQLPSLWTSAHKQDGCAHVYLIFVWDATLFPNGVPEITFLVSGKPVTLPGGSTAYSTNAAAIIRDYLTDTRYGLGIPAAQIDSAQYTTAYNKCNEDVGVIGGGTEKRYTINGVFKVSESPQEILESMCAAMGGTVTFVNGLWKIYPAAWRAPTLTLTEDDILGDIRVQTKLSRRDSFNGVRGTFISPSNDYEETDFPIVKNDYYMSLDNGERVWEDIQLSLTTSPATAQRLAKIELERNRQSITVQFTASLKAYQLEPMDTVMLTLDRMGWTQKIFEVQEVTLVMEGGDGGKAPAVAVQLLLRETAEAIYDWADGSETAYDIAQNTNLPNPLFVPDITGLTLESGTAQLYIRADGTVFSRIKVSWTAPDDFFVTSGGDIQIQYKQSADAGWIALPAIPGDASSFFILDVQDSVQYDVRVRAVNGLGVPGSWTTQSNYTVVGKTEKPSNVTGFTASIESFGIRFSWDKVADLDVNRYEIRIGEPASSWEDADFLTQVDGTTYSANIRLSNDYWFFIKAIDTSGNYSTEATLIISQIVGPEAPITTISINDSNYLLRWLAPNSLFAIDSYEIAYGTPSTDYADRTFVAEVRGTAYQDRITWSGTRNFWVTGIDVAGNYGTPYKVTLQIDAPSAVESLSSQVLDQNVLLRWQPPEVHTLPIDRYRVYKGAVFSTSTLIGEVAGTFSAIFELLGGNYTYWVQAIDTAGNPGTEIGISVVVQDPTDFVLVQSGDPDNGTPTIYPNTGTGVRTIGDDFTLLMPVNEHETWADHFVNNSWSTTQDAVDDGYIYVVQPVPNFAYWERVLDYGATVETALVTLDFNRVDYDGTVDLDTFLYYSLDGVTWSAPTEGQNMLATNFRYVKIRFQIGTFLHASGEAMGNIGLTYP